MSLASDPSYLKLYMYVCITHWRIAILHAYIRALHSQDIIHYHYRSHSLNVYERGGVKLFVH